jgi:hypothetical protein
VYLLLEATLFRHGVAVAKLWRWFGGRTRHCSCGVLAGLASTRTCTSLDHNGVLLQWVLRPSIAQASPLTKQQLIFVVSDGIYKEVRYDSLRQRLERKIDVEPK